MGRKLDADQILEEPTSLGSVNLFKLLVTSVRDYAIFALDPKGNVATWNEGAERIKGYTPEEIIGRHFSTFYPQVDIDAGKPPMELEVATREGTYEEEGWRIRKDGSRFWANVVITRLLNEAGELIGFAKVTRDLTERRDTQQREIENAKRLSEVEVAHRTKNEFLAAMSHELRTPLNAIAGYADLLDTGVGGTLSEQQCEYITRIRDSQEHLLGIITDLLNYTRIEAGQVKYDITTVPACSVMDKVVPMLQPQAAAKNITLEQTAPPPHHTMRADSTKAEQILINLLSNAVKFTPRGGRVEVECTVKEYCIEISVCDNGPGIDPGQQERIFEPFVQVGRSLSTPSEGAGLGLAISRDLARAMGGDVRVESEVGEGSTFTLVLPIAGPPESPSP